MKKTIYKIANFFSRIINKVIVVPISKLVLFINTKFEKPGKKIENWLSKSNTLLFISLITAIAIFVIIDQRILTYSESAAEVLTDRQVKVLYDEDNYVVEGVPEKVDITLIGSKADLYIAKQSPTNDVTINLWGYKPGTHKVGMKYEQATGNIRYSVNPSVATVNIYEKVSETKTLAIDLLNQDALDEKYIIDEVKASIDSVVIKGSDAKVKKVATVKALVDMKTLPKIELGKVIKVSSILKAYDESGNVVDVEISPEKADVMIQISSPSKEVPIQVIPKGSVIYNMGISNLVINNNKNNTVKIYGTQEVLAGIEYIPVVIDVEGLSESTQFKIDLTKPTGVKYMSINNVVVDVTLSSDISNRSIENVGISAINLGSNYGVTPIDVDAITVKIKGVTGVVKDIAVNDIKATIDLAGLGVGTYEVEVKVTGNDPKVEYLSSLVKIKVKIYNK
ncbi:MAG: CdaR family protein [Bacilli bacterium]